MQVNICINFIRNEWKLWTNLKRCEINAEAGVYKIKRIENDEVIYIGKSKNLKRRILSNLLGVNGVHAAGKRIRLKENIGKLSIQCLYTQYPAALEEYLLMKYRKLYKSWPKYNVQ